MKRKGCIVACCAGCAILIIVMVRGFVLGAGPLFRVLHLDGDRYDRYAAGGWYSGANPAMSPDGLTIVYSSAGTGRGDL